MGNTKRASYMKTFTDSTEIIIMCNHNLFFIPCILFVLYSFGQLHSACKVLSFVNSHKINLFNTFENQSI